MVEITNLAESRGKCEGGSGVSTKYLWDQGVRNRYQDKEVV